MSCYFRHMKDVLAEAGIEVTKDNKKEIDKIIHELVDVKYKDCSPTWKAVKERLNSDQKTRDAFVKKLKKRLAKIQGGG
ncbi:MAG: hypothetical protein JW932_17830 [Deltaproteobacteria bacterium]|nr:hypothetical protein [Deltaproteobacteria bacterium]